MAGVILCVFVITIIVIVVNLGINILKDIGWWKNFLHGGRGYIKIMIGEIILFLHDDQNIVVI